MTLRPGNNYGIASVDEERTALGNRLRELRKQSRLTGAKLAELLSWPASKVSKLQNGQQTPTEDDIRAWTRALGAEAETESLLVSLRTLKTRHAEWQRVLKPGMQSHQGRLANHDEAVKRFRIFENTVIPGLLQTPEYARARFAQVVMVHKVPNDINDAVQARMRRQEILYRPDKRFHIVLTEAALRYRLVSPDVMLPQLERLVALSALRTVRLGVIGFGTQYVTDPRHAFWLLDDDLVRFESYSAELNLRQPQEIELYGHIFESLAAIASYGSAARAIITHIMDDLAADAGEDSL
jgi:transcriptional regulator with XRE-family HTH domain